MYVYLSLSPLPFSSLFSQLFLSLLKKPFCLLAFIFLGDGFVHQLLFSSVQFSSSVMSDSLRPHESQHARLPLHHQLPEFTQTHVYWVGDDIQLSHPLSSPSPPAPNPSQHKSFLMSQLFAWGGQSIRVSASGSVLPMNTQDWSPLEWTGWISLQSKGFLRVFFNTTVQKHQFFSAQLSSQSNSHIHTWPLEKP